MALRWELPKLAPISRTRDQEVHALRIECWLIDVLAKIRLKERDFWFTYATAAELDDTSLPLKWLLKTAIPSESSIRRIIAVLDGEGVVDAGFVFELPIWNLLNKRHLTRADVLRYLRPYLEKRFSSAPSWSFPNEEESLILSPPIFEDSLGLFNRGDIYGFMGIVGLIRIADVENRIDDYVFHLQNLYRSLPAAGKHPWIKANFSGFCKCIERFRRWVPITRYVFQVDWNIIRSQIENPHFTPSRELRPRDPKSKRFVEINDPIVPSPIHLDWRELNDKN